MGWLHDLRYAARVLRANPGFSLAAIVTMCLGIGATTGVFSVVSAVVLQPLPFPDADRIVAVGTVRPDAPAQMEGMSLEELRDWRAQTHAFAAMAGWRDWGMLRTDVPGHEGVYGVIATPDLFRVFPAEPILGRLFGDADDVPGHNRVLLLTYPYWRDRFGGRADVIGTTMTLERGPRATYTVIGVLPPQFSEMPSFDGVKVFAPSSIDPDAATGRGHRNREVFARLRPGVSLRDAQAEAHVIASRLAQQYPATNRDLDARVITGVENETGPVGDTLRTLFAAVSLVLLIACGNVAGLQLVRALARRREFSIRQALGGTRGAIARAMLAETLLVSAIAGGAGLLVARWLVELVIATGPEIPRATSLRFDGAVFAFASFVCVAAAVLAALPASFMTTRLDLARALREESANIARAVRARGAFVAVQVALALVLLTGAVVAAQTLSEQLRVRPGFDTSRLATIRMSVPLERSGADVAALYYSIIDAARSVPGVLAASAVSAPPLSGESAEPAPLHVEGDPAGSPARRANTFNAAPGYFGTLGAPMTRGRDFTPSDSAAAPRVAIVNDTFARQYLAGRDPIGARVRVGDDPQPVQIVGVASDFRQQIKPRTSPAAEIYWPYAQRPRWATFIVVRGEQPGAAAALVRARIASIDRDLTVSAVGLMSARLARSTRGPRFLTLLFGLFAAVALSLSGIGVAGLVFYSSAQRTREIAVRVSLGATRRDVVRLVAGGAFRAVLIGCGIGLLGSIAVGRLLDSMLRQLDPMTPVSLMLASVLLVAVGGTACYLPARRALRLNPTDALRLE